jgi:hypothetical protein
LWPKASGEHNKERDGQSHLVASALGTGGALCRREVLASYQRLATVGEDQF